MTGRPPRTPHMGAAEHVSLVVATATVMCNPHTSRFWRINYPSGSTVTINLPAAAYVGPTGVQMEILNDGAADATISLVPGGASVTLASNRVASLAITNDPDIIPIPGGSGFATRWAAIIYEAGIRSGGGLLVAP